MRLSSIIRGRKRFRLCVFVLTVRFTAGLGNLGVRSRLVFVVLELLRCPPGALNYVVGSAIWRGMLALIGGYNMYGPATI